MARCKTCYGTGKVVVMRSWFTADGYSRVRCGICTGTGRSAYRSFEYEREQSKLRADANGAHHVD
jgi:hypothetical protein